MEFALPLDRRSERVREAEEAARQAEAEAWAQRLDQEVRWIFELGSVSNCCQS